MMNDALVTLTNPTMSYGKARVYGGAIYSGGSSSTRSTPATPALTMSSCTTGPSYFDSKVDGGFLYSNNPDLDVSISACSFSNLYADQYGGFVKGVQMNSFSLSSCGSTQQNVTARLGGSFIDSDFSGLIFSLSSCTFQCNTPATTLSGLPSTTASIGSLINLQYAGAVTSTSNTFKNCYTASQGSVFQLT